MSSELESLRQRISELEGRNNVLEEKNAKLKAEKTKLEQEFRSQIGKLEARNAELLKQLMEGNTKRDVENAELKSKVGEVESRLAIVEQGSFVMNGQPQNDKEAKLEEMISAVNTPVMDQCDQTFLEDKETDSFLDEVHKKKVSDEIRQRSRDKKLQAQESLSIPPEEKRLTQLISEASAINALPVDQKPLDSKCKKKKGVDKLKQELFVSGV
ncbi:hypothetical protein C1645_844422 [Glomus cerebriforme]|uniref:Uncharacterized protein n=1 Tax=Glomus cerebriforme TaxID=658196 RepID=A0A397T9G3_9GLOM|nr:hypothetical protein C1645_844422 [Glomus cerebriforme]